MRSGWVGGGVTDEKGGIQEKGASGPLTPPPPSEHAYGQFQYTIKINNNKIINYLNLIEFFSAQISIQVNLECVVYKLADTQYTSCM